MPQFEMTVTPLDFAMLTGLPFGGLDLSYDRNFGSNIEALVEMYGNLAHKLPTKGATNVSYSVFSDVFDNDVMLTELDNDQLVRCFITYLLSATIFADKSNKAWFHYLPCLRDLNRLGEYDWGAAGYANFLQHLRRACRVSNDVSANGHFSPVSVGGFWNILELWFYEYFPSCSPCSTGRAFPAAIRWALACRLPKGVSERPRMKDVNCFRDFINRPPKNKDHLLPWAESLWAEVEIPPTIRAVHDLTKRRILFKGPFGYVWYLGERVSAQYSPEVFVPADPPPSMFTLNMAFDASSMAALYGSRDIVESLPCVEYEAFRCERLAPLIHRCEVRTRVALPDAHFAAIGLDGQKFEVDIPELPEPVNGLPFPPDFKGFDRDDSEKLWRLLQASMKRMADLTSLINLWSAGPKMSTVWRNKEGLVGSSGTSPVLFDTRGLGSLQSTQPNANIDRGSKRRRLLIDTDSDDDDHDDA